MAEDKEAAFPIESFDGINTNVDREDLSPNQMRRIQNLWEREIGSLETRWNSIQHVSSVPSGIIGLDNVAKIYRSSGYATRYCAVQCQPDVQELSSLPTGVSLQFVTNVIDGSNPYNPNTTGNFNGDLTLGSTTYSTTPLAITIRFNGWGVDKWFKIATTSIPGYAATTQRLEVTIAQDLGENIQSFELLAHLAVGNTATPAPITSTSGYTENTLWIGCQELVNQRTGTFKFYGAPVSWKAGMTSGTTIGQVKRTFIINAFNNSNPVLSAAQQGKFEAGKTYYVTVLPQYTVFDANPNSRCRWGAEDPTTPWKPYSETAVITIPGPVGTFGTITITNMAPTNTPACIVAVGESRQTMKPVKCFGFSSSAFTFYVQDPCKHTPGVVRYDWTSADTATLKFNFSTPSRHDMFAEITTGGTLRPIHADVRYEHALLFDAWGVSTAVAPLTAYCALSVNYYDQMPKIGKGSRYNYVQYENYHLLVNNYNASASSGLSPVGFGFKTNYFLNDGTVAAPVIEEYKSGLTPYVVPNVGFIAVFEDSIILGGGIPTADSLGGGLLDTSRGFIVSRAGNPANFSIAGTATPVLNYFGIAAPGETVTGFGAYTNSTSDNTGPTSQFMIFTKNTTWIMEHIPVFTSTGTLEQSSLRQVSSKVGCADQRTIAYTPVGTMLASVDGIYLMRDNGEPTPVGQSLKGILRRSTLSKAVACYHDQHYKVSFYDPDYPGTVGYNNVEYWLNINKMIEKKGQEDWVGPMIGRAVDYCFVEDRSLDGLTYNLARDRFAIDREHLRVFKADVQPAETDTVCSDFGIPVTGLIESKNLEITQQDNNWNKIFKRNYWKLRLMVSPASFTELTYVDGALVDNKTGLMFASTVSGGFSDQPLNLIRLFPTSRIRGRTIRKVLSSAYRFALAGLQINYEVERRRI